MTKEINTVFDIHQKIYDTRKLIEEKSNDYTRFMELNNRLNIDSENIKIKINEVNINIDALNNLLEYDSNDCSRFTTLSIKNEYMKSLELLNNQQLNLENNINYIENEIYKLNIQFSAYDSYIDNLYKMIPRINRWGNIINMSQRELDIELYHNQNRFEAQLYAIDFPPPKLKRN